MYITKNKKVIAIDDSRVSDFDKAEIAKRKHIIMTIKRKQDFDAFCEYQNTHKYGYCPKCGMLIPLSGHCDCE